MSPAPFIAVDGEDVRSDNTYTLMACSDGRVLSRFTEGGISTVMAFEFLLRLPRPSVPVCFGLNYDVNNWVKDLPRITLAALWKSNVCYWSSYRIEWVPGRWFSVKDVDGRSVKIHEVFGFFQSSFVKALEAWGIGAPEEITRMKGERGSFAAADVDAVTRYCLHECELLVELMDGLRAACEDAKVVPRSWIGAGAMATALLGTQDMSHHHAYDLDLAPEQVVSDVVLGAYYAGRIELLRQGVYTNVHTADVRSAYPSAAMGLPSLDGAKLVHRKRWDASKHGLWHVSWDMRAGVSSRTQLAPFPTRHKKRIYYPLAGSGWYHTIEVATALKLGYPVAVHEGYVLRGKAEDRPFSWIKQVYEKRAKLKAKGHPAEKVLKLGLNSVYGKLAQGYGFNTRPRWQCYFWAGYITAATRAKVLAAAARCREPVMIATDGIFARGLPSTLRGSAQLGGWELGRVDELFAAQAGVYQGITPGEEVLKSRGFYASEVDYEALREGWEMEGASYVHHYPSHRFIGLGVALMRKDFSVWRRWVDETRSIHLAPERKVIEPEGVLTPWDGAIDSEPYVPKVALIEQKALDQMQGMDQPLKERI